MVKSLVFSCTLLVSSALIFLVEFTCAKMVLPILGGTPAVWNTSLVFFQAGLLLGYAYAHLLPDWLGVRRHSALHLGIWLLALLTLPFHLTVVGNPPQEPIFWLLTLLTISIGLPFVLLASCGPLVQRWFAAGPGDPYFLYTASNLGSMAGLVLYPFVVEPNLTLAEQNRLWSWLFAALIVLLGGCSLWLRGEEGEKGRKGEGEKGSSAVGVPPSPPLPISPSPLLPLRWVLLALAPSSLMLSVTSYLTTDIAPIPLLWMLPLALYLGSFVLVFAWHPPRFQAWMVHWLPGVVLLVLIVPIAEGTEPIWLILAIHLLGFFWIAMVCHGELARSKPEARRLTEFYLWLAVGGVLGGIFNALVAPLLFNSVLEYPLVLLLVGWLTPREKDVCAGLPGVVDMPQSWRDFGGPVAIALVTIGLVWIIAPRIVHQRQTGETSTQTLYAVLMFCPPGVLCLLAAERSAASLCAWLAC